MVEILTAPLPSKIQQSFADQAKPPTKKIADAEDFIKNIETHQTLDATTLAQGETLVRELEEQSIQYSFSATVLAAELSLADQDAQIQRIADGIEQAENIKTRLSATLQKFS